MRSAIRAPEYPGFVFGGWYTDTACTQAWDFETTASVEDLTLYANWTAAIELSSSGADGKINTGESFTLKPSIEGGTWSYDNEYLFLSGNTFTAIKSGVATVAYTVNTQTIEYSIAIEEKAAASATVEDEALVPTKQGFPWVAIIAALVAVLLIGGLLAGLKKHKSKG